MVAELRTQGMTGIYLDLDATPRTSSNRRWPP